VLHIYIYDISRLRVKTLFKYLPGGVRKTYRKKSVSLIF